MINNNKEMEKNIRIKCNINEIILNNMKFINTCYYCHLEIKNLSLDNCEYCKK